MPARTARPDTLGALRGARVDDPRQAVGGRVRERDPLVLVQEGLDRENGAEDLALDDLALVRPWDRRASARRRGRPARPAGRHGRSRPRSPVRAPRSRRRGRSARDGSAASPSCRRSAGRPARARPQSGGRAPGTARRRTPATRIRVPARQTWPASSNWPAAFRAAASRSQSSNTSSGPLPPSSAGERDDVLRRRDADVPGRLRRAGERDAADARAARRARPRSPRRSPARC